jgi:erythronate-4-phosphate dehydrogenase
MLTLIADSNIAHLHDYFNERVLQQPVNIIAMAGRDITAEVVAEYQPDALLVRSVTQVNEALLAGNDSVKFVGSATIGTDHIEQDYLANRQIAFSNAAGCSKDSVAQYVLTAILTLRPQYWHSSTTSMPTPIKLGIIGLGNIGSTLTHYALDLGWEVLGYDPLLPTSTINNASLEQVLTQSQAISLHVPLTTAEQSDYPTQHLIDGAALAQIPVETLLINTARGPVISETALLSDIANTQRKVVLDVFEHEPSVSEALLNQLAIATPHIAGYTLEGKLRGTQMIFDSFITAFGLPLSDEATPLMEHLLPTNPYHWSVLKQHPDQLAEFYNIQQDDALLREALDKATGQVPGLAFDQLRKNYDLRREWQRD